MKNELKVVAILLVTYAQLFGMNDDLKTDVSTIEKSSKVVTATTPSPENILVVKPQGQDDIVQNKINESRTLYTSDKLVINLTIKKFINEIVRRNSNILFEKMQSDIVNSQVDYEGSVFIPQFYANATHNSINNPNSVEERATYGYMKTYEEESNNAQLGIMGILPYATKWDLSISSNDKKSSLIKRYDLGYDTEYEDMLKLDVTQPLLRGFGEDNTKARYYLAKADSEIQKEMYKKRLMDVIGSAIQVYWEYYSNIRLKNNWKKSLIVNRQITKILDAKYLSGDTSYSEVLEAKSASMIREAELKRIESEVVKSRNEILHLMNVSLAHNKEIVFNLLDEPNVKDKEFISLDEYYQKALTNWPEIAIVEEKIKKEKLHVKNAKNMSEYQLDLILSASSKTLNSSREFEYINQDFLSWNAGLQYSMPILDDQGDSAIEMARLKQKQVELEYQSLRNMLYNAISTKREALISSRSQVFSYLAGLEIKKELYQHTNNGFKLGEKNIRDLLDQERDLIEYQRKLFTTLIEFKLSEVALDKATGSLIQKYLADSDIEKIEADTIDKNLSPDTFGQL